MKVDLALSGVNSQHLAGQQRGMPTYKLPAFWCARLPGVFVNPKEGANKQVISSQADSLIKISRIWADFFPANTSNQPI